MLRTLFLIHLFWLIYCHVLSKALAEVPDVLKNPEDLVEPSKLMNGSVVPPLTDLLTADKIIASFGYKAEEHSVDTEDNERFTLKLFRIPALKTRCRHRPKKPVVLFNHGMTGSADSWLIMGPKNGLPYLLSDVCNDVWLANCRGTRYSKERNPKIPDLHKYWDFSWHEIGMEDLPVIIDYILDKTNHSALHFVGYSQGATTLMVLLSMRPEYNEKIKTAQLLAPTVFMRQSLNLIYKPLSPILKLMPDRELLPTLKDLHNFLTNLCRRNSLKKVCKTWFLLSSGRVSRHMDRSVIPLLLATHPVGISTRQQKHYFQLKYSGRFQQYDFGSSENKIRYNKPSPPIYPLQNVRPCSPIQLYYSKDDETVSPKDIYTLINNLRHTVVEHLITVRMFDHADFLFSITANMIVNVPVIGVITKYELSNKKCQS
ncbi:lipase 3-like [Drosophila ficusphila]|uniref:lipase 3-like n=1 Tax=Drosophila ficusphila TaxID=30025 RepID=UPI0007E830B3|nr:lipase 3-like [Drosophila ficusphila]